MSFSITTSINYLLETSITDATRRQMPFFAVLKSPMPPEKYIDDLYAKMASGKPKAFPLIGLM